MFRKTESDEIKRSCPPSLRKGKFVKVMTMGRHFLFSVGGQGVHIKLRFRELTDRNMIFRVFVGDRVESFLVLRGSLSWDKKLRLGKGLKLLKFSLDSGSTVHTLGFHLRLQTKRVDSVKRSRLIQMRKVEDLRTRLNKTPMLQPKISLVVPVYNTRSSFLTEMVESVLSQAYPNWELLLINDCSTDSNTMAALKRIDGQDPRIRVIHAKQHGHISRASNLGIEIAEGEWCGLLDHDDVLEDTALAEMVLAVSKNPRWRFVYSDEDKLNPNGDLDGPYLKSDWNRFLLFSQNFICHFAMIETELIREVGGFRPGLEGAQDWDLFLRLASRLNDSEIGHVDRILYHWRIHSDSTALDVKSKNYALVAGRTAVTEAISDCAGRMIDVRVVHEMYLDIDRTRLMEKMEPEEIEAKMARWVVVNPLDRPLESSLVQSTICAFDSFERVGLIGMREIDSSGKVARSVARGVPDGRIVYPFFRDEKSDAGMGFRGRLPQCVEALCGTVVFARAELMETDPVWFEWRNLGDRIRTSRQIRNRGWYLIFDGLTELNVSVPPEPVNAGFDFETDPMWFRRDHSFPPRLRHEDGRLAPAEENYPV